MRRQRCEKGDNSAQRRFDGHTNTIYCMYLKTVFIYFYFWMSVKELFIVIYTRMACPKLQFLDTLTFSDRNGSANVVPVPSIL